MTTIDGRCFCAACEARTTDIYRMVGICGNCRSEGLLMLFRAGDKTRRLDCPLCGAWSEVMPLRMATSDEVPAS